MQRNPLRMRCPASRVFALVCGLAAASVRATPPMAPAGLPVTDGLRPLRLEFVLENTEEEPQTVAKVRPSCGCLAVDLGPGRGLALGEKVSFGVTYRSKWPGEGPVHESVSVLLVPSGRTVEFPVEIEVRRRLGFEPPEIAFGPLPPGEKPQERLAVLVGSAAERATLGSPVSEEEGHVFEVTLGEDGRSLRIRSPEEPPVSGILAETWRIPTDDAELPELRLAITASVEGPLVAVPTAVVLTADERDTVRTIRLRRRDGADFAIRSVALRPDSTGASATARRIAGGGWEVAIADLDTTVLRWTAGQAWVEIKTDVPGSARLRVPVRVDETEGVEP